MALTLKAISFFVISKIVFNAAIGATRLIRKNVPSAQRAVHKMDGER